MDISHIDYRQIIEYSLDPIVIHSNHRILYINKAAEEFFKGQREDILGMSPLDIFQESSKAAIAKRIQSAYERPADVIEETVYRLDGSTVMVELYCHPAKIGDIKGIQSSMKDITQRKEDEKKHAEMVQQVNALSSTLVPVSEGVSVLPLVGSFDEDRAMQLLEDVPLKAQQQNVECLIIDFSGIYNLDTVVTNSLFKIIGVMSLLGVHPIITGLRPELAQLVARIGVNLDSAEIFSTVKDAIRYCWRLKIH
ncbi:PAS domain S-box protein [Bacillus sp. SCS-153A]|uniref:PAS domain S-box protein n=1 Tax=Rossellomorea sedimentorum TaxID=3115294 RepID=UPI0039066BDC